MNSAPFGTVMVFRGLYAGGFGVLGIEFSDLDLLGETDFGEEPDAVVVDVELVPFEAVAGADGVGVVVVVPAFAAGEDGDPPVVAGVVLGLEAALAPEVRGGVDEPGGVESNGDPEEGSPENHAESADDVVTRACEGCTDDDLKDAGDDQGNVVIFAEPDVDRVAGEVRGVAAEEGGLRVHGATGEDPAGVCPPGAVVRGVRVAFLIGVLMVDAVSGYPEDRAALEREAATHRDEVLDPLGSLVTAMGEQAVVGHADTHVNCEEVHDDECSQILPGEEEKSSDGADVEEAHGDGRDPVDAALLVLAAHTEVLLDLLGDFNDGRDGGCARCGSLGCRDFFGGDNGAHGVSLSLNNF
jgi:hypothetical protein